MTLLSRIHAVALGASLLVHVASVCAEPVAPSEVKTRTERTPKRLVGVDVQEHLGVGASEALSFRDEQGRDVLLSELTRGKVPTIVTFNYSDCPMLCSLQLNALVASMRQMDLTLGTDYRIVTVSLNPKDTPERLRDMKARYVAKYGRPESQVGWTFLSGSASNIGAAAREFGFAYNYNEERDEYAHPAAFTVVTPGGVIARYLYGLEYHPQTLRLSLVEASEGRVGSSLDKLVLYCFHYDASEGRYAPMAMNIMRLTGGAGALALGGVLTGFWRSERKRQPQAKTAT
jgi:protein SCO1